MNFRSLADLDRAIVAALPGLPRDLEVIVGIPRSGLLAANMLALHLNLPLADVEGYAAGRLLSAGHRGSRFARSIPPGTRALVLDDSLYSGRSMDEARQVLRAARPADHLRWAAVFVRAGGESKVDYAFEILHGERLFEWNFMHHDVLRDACVDIDGVLCVDPTDEENDDGPRYARFLAEAAPLLLPSVPVGWLVTCRLEKYRAATEQWLKAHGVEYGELVMLDLPDAEARRRANVYSSFKAGLYRRTGARIFIESSQRQAGEIAALAGRPVLCVETRSMVYPGAAQFRPQRWHTLPLRLRRRLESVRRLLLARAVGFQPPPEPAAEPTPVDALPVAEEDSRERKLG